MGFTDILTFLLIGSGAGVLSGMFGIGGGVLIVPAIVFLTPLNLKIANGTSLAALMLPVGIFGCLVYYKEDLLDIKAALVVALGIICTVGIGAYTANILEIGILKICYSIFLFYIGYKFINPFSIIRKWAGNSPVIFETKDNSEDSTSIFESPADVSTEANNDSTYSKCFTIGILAGFISGLFGVGGGAVIVPMLISWLKLDTKRAIATSLGILLPPIGLPGVLVYYYEGNLNLPVAALVACGLFAGTVFGAKLTVRMPARSIKAAYGILLIITGIKFTLNDIIN